MRSNCCYAYKRNGKHTYISFSYYLFMHIHFRLLLLNFIYMTCLQFTPYIYLGAYILLIILNGGLIITLIKT